LRRLLKKRKNNKKKVFKNDMWEEKIRTGSDRDRIKERGILNRNPISCEERGLKGAEPL
jgi:hypothetical protein